MIKNFKIFFSILKFKKYGVSHFVHRGNVSMTSYRAVRDFSHRTVNISHRTVNPPTKYKQVVIGGIPHGENHRFLCPRDFDTCPPMNEAANNKLFKF
jgi:hypothetical protein